jgi:glycerol-3-phosphate acyltransferase PlsY
MPVLIAIQFTKSVDNQITRDLIRLAAAVLAVVGHDTMPFFKGGKGKGVATTAGTFLLLAPIPVLLGAATFFSLLLITPVASRRSIISGLVIVATCFIVNVSIVIKIGSVIAICLVLIRHKENIDRMIKGKE